MTYYKCIKCKETFQTKPLRHGLMSVTIYPDKPKPSKDCDGEIVEIDYNEYADLTIKQRDRRMEIPERRPDGMFVHDKPPVGSTAERRGLKKGDRVYGTYHDIQRTSFKVSGKILGFVRNDVMIYDKTLDSFVWIDGKNVFRL